MKVFIFFLAALTQTVVPFNFVEDPDSIHSCEVGDIIQNGRVTCTCTQNYIYECYVKNPSKSLTERTNKNATCQPNKVYVHESTTCICQSTGAWPHNACAEIFDSLPAQDVIKTKCQPNGYVFVNCNVCRCDSKGYVDKTRCTRNECHKSPTIRRSAKSSSVYGNCQAKNWYSLAPCQFCFCINENKLVCNTGNYNGKKLQLGTYNLSVCGKDLIREAIELIPDDDKNLRQGEPTWKVSTSAKPPSIPKPKVNTEKDNVEVDVDVEVRTEKFSKYDSSEKYSKHRAERIREASFSESFEENNEYDNADVGKVAMTQIPFEREDEDGTSDSEIPDPGLKIPASLSKTQNKPQSFTYNILENLGEQVKNNLPSMLNKVFKMALRKSMVSINNDSDCLPGSVEAVKCNTCFCLKNHKLLCTNNKCA